MIYEYFYNYKKVLCMLRSGIPGSSENTETNEVNLHGFWTNTFQKWIKLG